MASGIDSYLGQVLYSGYISQGPIVEEFENELKSFLQNPYVLTVNSGTSALTLALRLAGVGPGDEVISTPMTCSATNMAIMATGAKIVWADVYPHSGNIDPESVMRQVTKKTKAVMTVDWGGLPCNYEMLREAAPDITIIEDAAHAFGAEYRNVKIGSVADFTAFSFQAIKHLTTVDGGAVACRSREAYLRGKKLRWFGIDRDAGGSMRHTQDIPEWGYKFHMNDINASIGLSNMAIIDDVLLRHRNIAKYYNGELKQTIVCLPPTSGKVSSWWLYTMLLPDTGAVERFQAEMTRNGIETGKVHQRNDQLTCFSDVSGDNLPGVKSFYDRMICIPINARMTDTEVEFVASAARRAI